jgi:hypothetical protein
MIQALSDYWDSPEESEGVEAFFTGGHRRVVLENVGRFPHGEAPGWWAEAVLHHFRRSITPDSHES